MKLKIVFVFLSILLCTSIQGQISSKSGQETDNLLFYISVEKNTQFGGNVTGSGNYTVGQQCVAIATALNGYIFTSWKENGVVVSLNSTYTFTVTGTRTIVAYFTETGTCAVCPGYDLILNPATTWQTVSSAVPLYGCRTYKIPVSTYYSYTFKTGCGDGATADFDTQLEISTNVVCDYDFYGYNNCELNRDSYTFNCYEGYPSFIYVKVKGVGDNWGNFTLAYKKNCFTPYPPTYVNGPTSICEGTTNVYRAEFILDNSTPGITNIFGDTYIWTLPDGWTGSSTSDSIICTTGPSSGLVKVVAVNACGDISDSATMMVIVSPLPGVLTPISGPNSVCAGTTNYYSVSPGGPSLTYLWELPFGWSGYSTTEVIGAYCTYGVFGGEFVVTPYNFCGAGPSQYLFVSVNQLPTQPISATANPSTIYQGGSSVLSCNPGGYYGYETNWWTPYCNDGVLAGTGESIIVSPTTTTTYYVSYDGMCGTSYCESVTVNVIAGSVLNIVFPAGYTWFSVNMDCGNWNLNTLFGPLSMGGGLKHPPSTNDMIIGQSSFATYYASSWIGSLSTIDPKKMYLGKFASQDTLVVVGSPVAISPISLPSGYTWLGYLPQCIQSPGNALYQVIPGPTQNDRLIAQSSFAVYYGTSWLGSLTSMMPGKGYKISMNTPSTLSYGCLLKSDAVVCSQAEAAPMAWNSPENMQFAMQVICKVKNNDGGYFSGNDILLGAFYGNECRGSISPSDCLEAYFFLSISSDIVTGEPINLKIQQDGNDHIIKELLYFKNNKTLGTIDDPVILTLADPAVIADGPDNFMLGNAFPNPSTEASEIEYKVATKSEVKISIFDCMGNLIDVLVDETKEVGTYHFQISGKNLDHGMYYYQMLVINGFLSFTETKKIIFIK
jgi:hypothetical protein